MKIIMYCASVILLLAELLLIGSLGLFLTSLFTHYHFMQLAHMCLGEGQKWSLWMGLPAGFKYIFGFLIYSFVGWFLMLIWSGIASILGGLIRTIGK